MGTHYLIRWLNTDAIGSVDLIDDALLQTPRPAKKLKHATRLGRTVLTSTFDIELDGESGIFCYAGENAAANEAQGIYRGDMRIVPKELASANTIAWRDSPEQQWEMYPVKIERLASVEGIRRERRGTTVSRDSGLAFFKRADAKAKGALACEACGFDGLAAYGDAIDQCFEVHHKQFVAEGERVTELDDLVTVCANCHKAIHGLGDLSFDDFKANFVSAD